MKNTTKACGYFWKQQLVCFFLLAFSVGAHAQYEDEYTVQTFLQFTSNGVNTPGVIRQSGISKELVYLFESSNNENKDSILREVIFYNEKGNIIEKWRGLARNKIVEKYSYGFDSLERPAVLKINFNDPGSQIKGLEVEYDVQGREANSYQFNIDTSYLLIRHKEYDSSSRLERLYTKLNNDSLYNSHWYHYDEKGRLRALHTLGKNDESLYSYQYFYDDGKRTGKVSLAWNNILKPVGEFTYDKFNRLVKVTTFNNSLRKNDFPLVETGFGVPEYFQYPDHMVVSEGSVSTYFIYNSDGTIYESHIRKRESSGKKSFVTRHYYVKEE